MTAERNDAGETNDPSFVGNSLPLALVYRTATLLVVHAKDKYVSYIELAAGRDASSHHRTRFFCEHCLLPHVLAGRCCNTPSHTFVS
jgi:hypothetical protein